MKLFIRFKFHHLFLSLLIITSLFSFRFITPTPTYAWGANCQDNQVFVSNGQIVVVQHLSDFPVGLADKNTFQVEVTLKSNNNQRIALTENVVPEPGSERWCAWIFGCIDKGSATVTYTISRSQSIELADLVESGTNPLDVDLKILVRGPDSQTDNVTANCNVSLTADQIDKIKNGGDDTPTGACPNGCKDEETCQYSGTGNIEDPNNWSCQKESLTIVDVHGSCGKQAIDTALGCVPLDTQSFTKTLIKYAIGLAGFTALAIMLIGTIIILTGGSNPEQVKKGKEIFTSAILGLLFIIFSAVILKIINQDILKFNP